MKSVTGLMAIAMLSSATYGAVHQCPQAMSSTVETRLLPVLRALDRALKRDDIWDKKYQAAFDRLTQAKDNASAQARVALMDYYIGEAYSEELVCAVALDGVRSKAFVELYEKCDIQPRVSPIPRTRELPLRRYALKIILEGTAKKSCTYE